MMNAMALGMGMASMMPAQQARHAGNMMNMTMGAINQENQSRVAQQREARRMQHERDMLLMRLRGMNQPQQPGGQMTPQQMAAFAMLRQEEEAGRTGTVRMKALRTLGML